MRNNKHLCTNLARLLYSYTESEEHVKPVTVKTYLNERFQCLKSLRHKLCILSINHPNTLNYEYYKQYMWNFRSHSICRCTPCSLIHFNHKIPKVSRSLQEQHINRWRLLLWVFTLTKGQYSVSRSPLFATCLSICFYRATSIPENNWNMNIVTCRAFVCLRLYLNHF